MLDDATVHLSRISDSLLRRDLVPYREIVITPLGREMRDLARKIADGSSQMGDIEQQQTLRRELERKLADAGETMKEIAKAAGVSRLTAYVWSRQAHKGRYPTL